ncbi:chaperonin 10-like protein [Panaeolus papilionaceus]|nr:chaperonin 10-like protein [Panaeolus papilionaceus]
MKALVWHGARKVSMEDVPVPTVNEPDDIILRVTGTTVCGSDLHLYNKEIIQLKDGDILGHEFCGIVDEVGPNVTEFKPGDRVVSSFQIACGNCQFCKKGLTSMCDTTNSSSVQEKLYGNKIAGVFGYSHFVGGFPGGQAEYVRIPFGQNNVLKIPDNIPDEKALYLSDVIPTSYHAVKCADVQKGSTVAIWGLGPIGLNSAQWAKIEGASLVIGIDTVDNRLELAKSKLGIEVIDPRQTDVLQRIHELTNGTGVDCSIDAAGFRYTQSLIQKAQRAIGLETDASQIINEILRSTRKFGTVSLIADYAATTNGFLIGAVMEKGITLRGAGQCPVQKYWHDLLKRVESGEFDPTVILTHRFSIEEIPNIYAAMDQKTDNVIKSFVQTRFSAPPAPGTPPLSSLKAHALN